MRITSLTDFATDPDGTMNLIQKLQREDLEATGYALVVFCNLSYV